MPSDSATATRRLLIDSGLLLVLVIGLTNRSLIGGFKRTRQYTTEDYDLLLRYVGSYDEILVTPNVLTEVSNLAGQLTGEWRTRCFRRIATLVASWTERYLPTVRVVQEPLFARLGLTDAGTFLMAEPSVTLLTDDLDLYLARARAGHPVVNFTHLRAAQWALQG